MKRLAIIATVLLLATTPKAAETGPYVTVEITGPPSGWTIFARARLFRCAQRADRIRASCVAVFSRFQSRCNSQASCIHVVGQRRPELGV
jgi:hypothetical protein